MRIEIDVPDEVCDAFEIARKGEDPAAREKEFVLQQVGVLGVRALMAKHQELLIATLRRFQAEAAQ